ncbi:hypothetical protein GF420_03600 [candidate division GN15 bacterium]|nr:hypothetical protein [candidate division GN15 bacterium]
MSGRDGGAIFVSSDLSGRLATIEYCAFYQNKARTTGTGYGGALRLEGRTLVRHSTFFRNTAGEGCGVSVSGDSGIVAIENCNITFNANSGIQVLGTGNLSMECSNLYDNTGGHIVGTADTSDYTGRLIFEDPLFCDTANADFTLSSFSPCTMDSSPCDLYIGQYYMSACDYCCNLAGDVNNDGFGPDLIDIQYLTNALFLGGPAIPCPEEGDANGNGNVDMIDVQYLVNAVFHGGPAPVCP